MKSIILLVLISFLTLKSTIESPSCQINDGAINSTKFFITQNETFSQYLDQIFSGYNLRFSVITTNVTGVSVEQYLQYAGSFNSSFSPIKSTSILAQPDGSVFIAILSTNYTLGEQQITFAMSDKSSVPTLNTSITLTADPTVQCYDINQITQGVAIVSCIKMIDPMSYNYESQFFIVGNLLGGKISNQTFSDYFMKAFPYTKEGQYYTITDEIGNLQRYFFSYVPFDMLDGENNYGYITPFRYFYDPAQATDFPAGFLVENEPIGPHSFGLNTLRIVDLEVLGNWTFMLEATHGIYRFNYFANEVINLYHYDFNLQAWGLAADWNGDDIILIVVGSFNIYEFVLENGSQPPIIQAVYDLDFQINGIVEVQANDDFILLSVGTIHQVFKREMRFRQNYLLAETRAFQEMDLLYSDTLFGYNMTGIYNLQLFHAAITFAPEPGSTGGDLAVVAVSRQIGFNPIVCHVNFNVVYLLNPESQQMFDNGYNYELANQVVTAQQNISITLNLKYIGPNLHYRAPIGSKQEKLNPQQLVPHPTPRSEESMLRRNFEQKEQEQISVQVQKLDGEVPAFMWIDQAREGLMRKRRFDQSQINFIRTVTNGRGNFIQFFGSNTTLTWYGCLVVEEVQALVDCTFLVNNVQIPSRVVTFAHGYIPTQYSQDQIFLFATENSNLLIGYHMSGMSVLFQVQYGTNETVEHVALDSNLIYVVVNSTGSQYIDVRSFDTVSKSLYHITETTIAGWNVSQSFTWQIHHITTTMHLPHTLFISAETGVLGVDTSGFPSYLFYMNYPSEVQPTPSVYADRDVLVFIENGFAPQFSDYKIVEYNINNLNNITHTKFYPMYNYTNCPSQNQRGVSTFSQGTGNVYVIGYDINDFQESVLLTYRVHQPNIETLTNVHYIEYGKANNVTLISADGDRYEDNVVVLFDGELSYFKIPLYPTLWVSSTLNNPSIYVQQINYTVTVQPWDPVSQAKTIQGNLLLINEGTSIVPNYTNINESGFVKKGIQINSNSAVGTVIPIPTYNWFVGSVTGLAIDCQGSPCSAFTIQNQVWLARQNVNKLFQVKDMFFDDEDADILWVMQQTNVVKIQAYYTNYQPFRTPIILSISQQEYNCKDLIPHYAVTVDYYSQPKYTLDALFAVCQDVQLGHLVLFPIPDPYGFSPYPTLPVAMPGIFHYNQIQAMDGYILINQDNQIYVYEVYYKKQQVNLIAEYNAQTLGINGLQITNFHVYPTDNPATRKVFLANETQSLIVLDVNSNQYGDIYNVDNVTVISLPQILLNSSLYLTPHTILLKFQVLDFYNDYQEKLIVYDGILLTSDTASYEFRIFFNAIMGEPIMTFIELVPTGCFDNYGQNLPMEMMGSGPVFAVGFLNITTHVGTVAVYDRAVSSPHRPTKPFAAKANVPLKFMSGGESFTGIDLSIGLQFNWYKDPENTLNLIIINPTQTRTLSAYGFNATYSQLIVHSGFSDQIISLIPQSQYATIAAIQIPVYNINPNVNPSSSKWWIYLLIALGAVLIIGLIAFIIWKIKNKQPKVEQYEKVSDSEKISMQEPTKA